MFSAVTERGAADTLEALALRRVGLRHQAGRRRPARNAQLRIREDLVPKIKSLCRLAGTAPGGTRIRRPAARPATPFTLRALGPAISADVVAMSLSTGGPAALGRNPVEAAGRLSRAAAGRAAHGADVHAILRGAAGHADAVAGGGGDGRQAVRPGVVHVAPADFHLTVSAETAPARARARSVAAAALASAGRGRVVSVGGRDVYGSRALALVLTGMGQDGLSGCEDITAAGGRVMVQDEATSVVWEMARPGGASRTGRRGVAAR